MEISPHCSSWSTKFGSNRIGGIGEAIYLGGERASRALYVCMCVCDCVSSFILQGNEQGSEDAPGGNQIITHLGSETEISLTLPCAEPHIHRHTRAYTHACVQCINVTKGDKSHFHLGTERHRSSTNTCIYSKWRRLRQGIVPASQLTAASIAIIQHLDGSL